MITSSAKITHYTVTIHIAIHTDIIHTHAHTCTHTHTNTHAHVCTVHEPSLPDNAVTLIIDDGPVPALLTAATLMV